VSLGFLYNQASRHLEVAIVFPALVGLLAGTLVALAVRSARLPVGRATLVACALAGGLAYASSFYFDYREFRADLALVGQPGATLATAQVDRIEAQLLGSPGMFPYLHARADNGMGAQGPVGIHATGMAAWALWTAQIALAAGFGVLAARTATRIGPAMLVADPPWRAALRTRAYEMEQR
jgi:hypothetical protein